MKNGIKERALKGRELIVVFMEHSRVYEEWTKTAEQHQILVTNEHRARRQALMDAKAVIDFAMEIGCKIVTLWPGQDGYDYIFAADYIKERQLFADAVEELCKYCPDVMITLEYKIKEPRTHSYISTVGATLLMIEKIGLKNSFFY